MTWQGFELALAELAQAFVGP